MRPALLKPRSWTPKNYLLHDNAASSRNHNKQQPITSIPSAFEPNTMAEASSSAAVGGGGGGIDRKADERMEFSTSKEVTVHPTFESMSLKGKFVLLVPCAHGILADFMTDIHGY